MSEDHIRQQLLNAIAHPCDATNRCQPCVDCKRDKRQIVAFMDEGHTYHCACRLVWGDGQCECGKQGVVPGLLSREVLQATYFGKG